MFHIEMFANRSAMHSLAKSVLANCSSKTLNVHTHTDRRLMARREISRVFAVLRVDVPYESSSLDSLGGGGGTSGARPQHAVQTRGGGRGRGGGDGEGVGAHFETDENLRLAGGHR